MLHLPNCGVADSPRRRSIHRQALAQAAGVPLADVYAAPVRFGPSPGGAGGAYGQRAPQAGLTLLTRVTFASNCTSANACGAAAREFAAQVNALLEAPITSMLNLKARTRLFGRKEGKEGPCAAGVARCLSASFRCTCLSLRWTNR